MTKQLESRIAFHMDEKTITNIDYLIIDYWSKGHVQQSEDWGIGITERQFNTMV